MSKNIDMNNKLLIVGGLLSMAASGLHVAVIIGGADWYRFFGAGEKLSSMQEQGSWIPALITFAIALVLFVWGLYAFSGAGLIRRLPFLTSILVIISLIYLGRGFVLVPFWFGWTELVDSFALWSSLICMIYGLCYAIGTIQVRESLNE